jgi:hypothetical protein
MSASVASRPARTARGGGSAHRPSRQHNSNSADPKFAGVATLATDGEPITEESEELRALRRKHADKLKSLQELFPAWTDEDLLSVLNDVNGSLETAVGRISEGSCPTKALCKLNCGCF